MEVHLSLSPKSLYPILSHDFHLISDTKLFSNLIATHDFSRVMSKLQLLKLKKAPVNIMFSMKIDQEYLPVLMHGEYKNQCIYVTLYDLNTMDEMEMKKMKYNKKVTDV